MNEKDKRRSRTKRYKIDHQSLCERVAQQEREREREREREKESVCVRERERACV